MDNQSIVDLKKIHEEESFALSGPGTLSWDIIQSKLTELGFTFDEDTAELMRRDAPPQWQFQSVGFCMFVSGGRQVCPEWTDFDQIRYLIPVAILPADQVTSAIHLIHFIGDELSLSVSYKGNRISREESLELIKTWVADVLAETGHECGSEAVRMLIDLEQERILSELYWRR